MSSSKKRCGIDNCPSTRYEFQDGLLYCGEGHQQEVRLINRPILILTHSSTRVCRGYTCTTNIHNSKDRRHRPTRIFSSGRAERAERSARARKKSQKVNNAFFTIYTHTHYPASFLNNLCVCKSLSRLRSLQSIPHLIPAYSTKTVLRSHPHFWPAGEIRGSREKRVVGSTTAIAYSSAGNG